MVYPILEKERLSDSIIRMAVQAPAVARKAQPGQFIILRVREGGERIPLTIADFDRERGTVTIIFQVVGKTTQLLSQLEQGQAILDFVGPLGNATQLSGYKRAVVVAGGLGTAIAIPQARALHGLGAQVDVILGFRSKDLIILEQTFQAVSDRLWITTDDGSNGRKGFVTDVLKAQLEQGAPYDLVVALGPLVMMKAVSELTRPYGIKTIVSLNPVMVDGTGMCGGCRVTVGGQTRFACVDGPDFDGHEVDFDEAIRRQQIFRSDEQAASAGHPCRLTGEKAHG